METSRLHIVARKLKTMFLDELQHAASTGFLKPKLAIPLMELRKTWISHTTQNERINKMLSLFGDRCPYATNDLVSARAMLKHGLSACDTTDAQGKKKAEKKWKTVKPVAQKLSESCLASWDNHAEILSNPERWVPPSATDSQLPSDAALASQMSKLCPKEHSASLVWATCYNMRWTQLVKSSPDVSSTSPWFVIGFGVRESANARKSDFVFYFCAETLGFELTADLIGQVFVCMSLCLMPMFTLSSFIVWTLTLLQYCNTLRLACTASGRRIRRHTRENSKNLLYIHCIHIAYGSHVFVPYILIFTILWSRIEILK